jgi:hypothetical protein
VAVALGVGVFVGTGVAVAVGVGVDVLVGTDVGLVVGVGVDVGVAVGVGVDPEEPPTYLNDFPSLLTLEDVVTLTLTSPLPLGAVTLILELLHELMMAEVDPKVT